MAETKKSRAKVTVIEPSYQILYPNKDECEAMFERLEDIARVCYKSEDKKTPTSKYKLITRLRNMGHHAMLEHSILTVKFITTRGFSHELVRHRIASYAQESQRYVNYKNGIQVICPPEIKANPEMYKVWLKSVKSDIQVYQEMIEAGFAPQIARSKLPNCIKTEIVISANWREWRNIFKLRISKAAHPEMRELMIPLLADVQNLIPVVFDDIHPERPKIDEINLMGIKEFMDAGFLQELNRQFLHPLGLAMYVNVEDDGTTTLGGIWDYRDDPEGMLFGDNMISKEKAENVKKLFDEKAKVRQENFGYVIQPVEEAQNESSDN